MLRILTGMQHKSENIRGCTGIWWQIILLKNWTQNNLWIEKLRDQAKAKDCVDQIWGM